MFQETVWHSSKELAFLKDRVSRRWSGGRGDFWARPISCMPLIARCAQCATASYKGASSAVRTALLNITFLASSHSGDAVVVFSKAKCMPKITQPQAAFSILACSHNTGCVTPAQHVALVLCQSRHRRQQSKRKCLITVHQDVDMIATQLLRVGGGEASCSLEAPDKSARAT